MIALQGESLTRRCRNRVGAGGICGVGKSMATACAEEVGRMEFDEAVLAAAGKLGGYYDCIIRRSGDVKQTIKPEAFAENRER